MSTLITDYKLVKAIEVSAYIVDGWQPWGSPIKNGATIHQAIVYHDDITALKLLQEEEGLTPMAANAAVDPQLAPPGFNPNPSAGGPVSTYKKKQ